MRNIYISILSQLLKREAFLFGNCFQYKADPLENGVLVKLTDDGEINKVNIFYYSSRSYYASKLNDYCIYLQLKFYRLSH